VATQAPLSVADGETSIVALHEQLRDAASRDHAATQRLLRELHDVLIRMTPGTASPPIGCLELVRDVLDAVGTDATDALSPRPRTAFRLLRAGALDAAWDVLTENAVGVVAVEFDDSTATGVARTAWRLPLSVRVESGTVYAELPGFRDPRFVAPDSCYDLTAAIHLHAGLDSIDLSEGKVRLGGWAAYDVLNASPDERIAVVASRDGQELQALGKRVRRPDFVSGRGERLHRRAWAGWAAEFDLTGAELSDGVWTLSVQLDHDGLVRRTPLGAQASDFARATAASAAVVGGRQVSWQTDPRGWRLVTGSR
jgi:hypothetical protein